MKNIHGDVLPPLPFLLHICGRDFQLIQLLDINGTHDRSLCPRFQLLHLLRNFIDVVIIKSERIWKDSIIGNARIERSREVVSNNYSGP